MTDPKDKKARIIPTHILELSEEELEDLLQTLEVDQRTEIPKGEHKNVLLGMISYRKKYDAMRPTFEKYQKRVTEYDAVEAEKAQRAQRVRKYSPWVAGAATVGVLAAFLVPWRCESVGSMIMRRLEMKQNIDNAPKVEISDTGVYDAGTSYKPSDAGVGYDAGPLDASVDRLVCPDGESCYPNDSIICEEEQKCYSENAVLCKEGEQCYDPGYVTDLENKLKICEEDPAKKKKCEPTYIPRKCPPVAECPALPLMRTDNYNDTIMR